MDSLENKVYAFMGEEVEEDEEEEDSGESELQNHHHNHHQERTLYWESQEAMLQEIIERYNMEGCELREEIGEILEEARKGPQHECNCRKPNSTASFWCSHCLRTLVVSLLSLRGYSASLCLSKWDSSRNFPAGSHEYIEVMPNTKTRKKLQMPTYIIEMELRDQFEIARAGEEYKKLASLLPEFYVGKPEYLTAIIRVMCGAAKRSMKEKKIHMGPWRKSSFMQMKWSSAHNNNNKSNTWNAAASTLPSFHLMQAATNEACIRVSRAHTMVVT